MIKQLELRHFGKFHNTAIDLQPHINIVYGENEAGKSTVHQFIHSMLFGAERLRGRGAGKDNYTRYQPWVNGKNYEGSMIISHEGEDYRLTRSFYKEDEFFSLVNVAAGRPVPVPGGTIEDMIEGLNESNYKNTISIRQQESRLDDRFSLSLQNHIANLGMAKDEEIHIESAVEELKKQRKSFSEQLGEDEIGMLKESIYSESKQLERKASLVQKQEELLSYEKRLTQNLKALQKEREVRSRESKEEQFKAVAIKEKLNTADRIYQQKAEAYRILKEEHEASFNTSPFRYLSIGLIAAALLIMLMSLTVPMERIMSYIVMAAGVLLLAGGLYSAWKYRQRMQTMQNAMNEGDMAAIKQELRSLKESHVRLEEALAPYVEKYGPDLMGGQNTPDERILELKDKQSVIGRQLERLGWEIEQLDQKAAVISEQQEQLETLLLRHREIETEIKAIDLALDTIDQLTSRIHETFGQFLNREVTDMFNQITGQSFERIFIDDQFKIRIEDNGRYIPLENLSAGTIDQMHFALRFAASYLIFGQEQMPVILDDTFTLYDDRRLKNILDWIISHTDRQIILFTCHHREADMLDHLGSDYNYIDLNR